MNLPKRVDDPSLQEHEPLRSFITIHGSGGSRVSSQQVISGFIKEVRQDCHAAAAIREWIHLVFQPEGASPGQHSFEATDDGEELYKAFFEYQIRLSTGDDDKAHEYHGRIVRRGTDALNLEDRGANTQPSTREKGKGKGRQHSRYHNRILQTCRPRDKSRQADAATKHPDTVTPSLGRRPRSRMSDSATQQEPPLNTFHATGAEATKPSPRSMARKKKRKAYSQKSPVITASDASEDDKVSPKFTPTSTMSRQPKRISSKPCHQSQDLRAQNYNNQVERTNSGHRSQYPACAGIIQHQSPTKTFGSEDFVFPPSFQGRRSTRYPLAGHKHGRKRIPGVATRLTGAGSNSRVGNKGPVRDHSRANKRPRRESMPTPCSCLGEAPQSDQGSRAPLLQEEPVKESVVATPLLTKRNLRATSMLWRKRTRAEFETGYVASYENAGADTHEPLGPDNRTLRPLPKKVYDWHLAPLVTKDTASGVPCGTSFFKQVDQLLQDAASNALIVLREGIRPDVPDWTQEKEYDADCDDLDECDAGEANDEHVTATTSVLPAAVTKPPLPALPRIWAQTRQEVCESFEYFRSYHSGVYSKDDIVKGYLLGAYAASRDTFHHGGKLIISHGGGKSESILEVRGGPRRYQKDQDQEASDKSVRALLKTWKDRLPVALLADDRYALFPYDLASGKYTYVVLGLYWISHAWAECQPARDGSGRIIRWKFAFQWCEGQGDPWWLPQLETRNISSDSLPDCKMRPAEGSLHSTNSGERSNIRCEDCLEQSPCVYRQGWMCLNPHCSGFWSIDGKEPIQLDYREEFLTLLPQTFERLPDLTPARVDETTDGITTTYAFSKGLHCTQCGRLSCRFMWERWECSNCKFKHVVSGRLRSPKEFWGQRPSRGFEHSQLGKDSGIIACQPDRTELGGCKGSVTRLTFILPHGRGKIHLILGTQPANGDANNIFELYQRQASTGELKLRRYPLRNHRARGLLLTNYFSQNSGEPYQYVGGTGNTVPFDEAPECVQRALALIKERSSLALRTDIPFNEVLSAAYMERQKMAFHSDSEKGLGPIVASLSLGSAALMHFRLHVNAETPKKNGCALTLALRHGDVLIMEGDGVQKYYEHTVVPMNFRIAATARCIGST